MGFLTTNRLLLCLLACVTFLAFAKLGDKPPHLWDESRTGINAVEMLHNGDWINLHFAGEPDNIRAKPPLMIWLVAGSFQLFGYSTFSLRFPSAIATILIFFFLFKLINLYKPALFAFAVGLMLLPARGLIGYHVGRTGDFDALLLCFLLAGLYHFLRYFDFGKTKAIYWTSLFLGLAFMTKGPAMAVIFPGILLYILQTGRFKEIFKKEVYLAGGLCFLFPLGWFFTIQFFGAVTHNPEVSGTNAIQRMFLYDLLDRFTQTKFEGKQEASDPFFLFKYLELNFKYWHYVFQVVVLLGLARMLFTVRKISFSPDQLLMVLSINIWFTLSLFLSIGTASKTWYMAPAIPFIAITTLYGLEWFYNYRYRRFWFMPHLFGAFLAFTLCMRFLIPDTSQPAVPNTPGILQQYKYSLRQAPKVTQMGKLPPQNVLLDLYFCNPKIQYNSEIDQLEELNKLHTIFLSNNYWLEHNSKLSEFRIVGKDENYIILQNNNAEVTRNVDKVKEGGLLGNFQF